MMQAKEKAPQAAATAQGAKNNVQNQSTADQAVCQAPEIRGFQFLGYIANKRTNRRLVPLYKPQKPTDGQPSINTLEGWNFFLSERGRKAAAKTVRQKAH